MLRKCRVVLILGVCLMLGGSAIADEPTQAIPVPGATKTVAKSEDALVQELQKAADRFNQSDFTGALEALKGTCAAHPELAPARIFMAQWFAQAGLAQGVNVSLEAATEEYPDDPEAFLLLGEILLRQGALTGAELMLKKGEALAGAYDANPERKKELNLLALRNLAALAEIRMRWTEMEQRVDAQIVLAGESAPLLRQKAVALFQQKKDAEARELFAKADTLLKDAENKGLPADAAMSQLYLLRGDTENAQKSLSAALTAFPKSQEVLALAVAVRLNEDKLEEAKELVERLRTENPESSDIKRLQATVALFLSDWTMAETLFQELVVSSPADSIAINGLALALCEQGDDAKLRRAAEYAAQNVRTNPQNSEFLGTLGWILYKAKEYSASAEVLKKAVANGQVNAATAYTLARLAVQGGQTQQAVELLQAALNNPQPFAKRREAEALLKELLK